MNTLARLPSSRGKEGDSGHDPTAGEPTGAPVQERGVRSKRPLPPAGMTGREFLRETFRPSPGTRSFDYRGMWRRHPVVSALYVVVAVGLTVLGVLNLVDGHSRVRSALYLVFWIAWIALLTALVRRGDPPSEL
jgi:hypothetical protein